MPALPKDVSAPSDLVGLTHRWFDARRRSDQLFGLVRPDCLYDRPIAERHRIIFYIGHLDAFDWNLLNNPVTGLDFGIKTQHPEFDRLFAFGIDPLGGGLPTDVPSDWPSRHSVDEYVHGIRSGLDDKILGASLKSETADGFSLATLLNVAIEHRLMHVETLAYMLHQLPHHKKVKKPALPNLVAQSPVLGQQTIPPGTVTLGLSRNDEMRRETFGWDNEFESHTMQVAEFAIDRYKVTNRQYLEFMESGGYESNRFWSTDDWKWKTEHRIAKPLFWKRNDEQWFWLTMFDELRLPLDWPVYVSQAEASAYARWVGKALPTEAQWQRAAYGGLTGSRDTEKLYPWGNDAITERRGNFDFHGWDPTPVNAFPDGQSEFGVQDMLGNGWEWTSTVFHPFRGFQPFPFYRGYSADFFDGKHFVMKGGSARTAACMLRPSFRNWFQAHYQNVYAGFRCVSC